MEKDSRFPRGEISRRKALAILSGVSAIVGGSFIAYSVFPKDNSSQPPISKGRATPRESIDEILGSSEGSSGIEREENLYLDIKATSLRIPSIGLDRIPVSESSLIDNGKGEVDFSIPPTGVATPRDRFLDIANKAWIFGHSRWMKARQALGNLDKIEQDDEIIIDGIDRTTGEEFLELRYKVERIIVADEPTLLKVLTGQGNVPRIPKIIIQTSLRQNVQGADYLFDIKALENKKGVEFIFEKDPNNYSSYLFLVVIGTLSREDVLRLMR